MVVGTEKLREVSLTLVPSLKKLLENDSEALLHCQILDLYVKCKKAVPERDIRLYTPNGQIDQYGTNVLFVPEHRYTIFFHTTDPDHDRMKQLLLDLEVLDWNMGPVIGPISNCFYHIIEDIANQHNLTFDLYCPANNYILENDQAERLARRTPAGTELRPLKLEHAAFIDERWSHKNSLSLKLIEDNIITTGGYGLFDKHTGEMLSWGLHALYGGVGFMQTAPQQRGKGYGAVVARAVTKKMAEDVDRPQVQIKLGNNASVTLFTGMGYKFTHLARWVFIQPKCDLT